MDGDEMRMEDIVTSLQQNRFRWYCDVMKDENDWIRRCVDYEVGMLNLRAGVIIIMSQKFLRCQNTVTDSRAQYKPQTNTKGTVHAAMKM